MFNLLRMDLRRLFRGKMLYICLAATVILCGLVFYGFYVATNPQALEELEKVEGVEVDGGSEVPTSEEIEAEISSYNVLGMVQDSVGASGVIATLCLAVLQVLVIEDFESGFAKGIFSTYKKRWKYLGSKLITGGLISFIFLAVNIAACFAINGMMGNFVPPSGIKDILFYVANMWLLLNAFNALILLICVAFRNKAIGITAVILLGLGVVVALLRAFLGLFDLSWITEYTLSHSIDVCPLTADGFQLRLILLGVFFLVVYAVVSKFVLDKADI